MTESQVSHCVAKMAMLDVGHGSASVLYGGKEAVVFDCPPGFILLKFLRQHGIAVIRHLILSHSDKDHIGGVAALINSGIAVEQIWILDDQENRTLHYKQVAHAFAAARAAGNQRLKRGKPDSDADPASWGRFEIYWLGPNQEDRMLAGSRNALSVVARLALGRRGIALFTGDVTFSGLSKLDPNRDWTAQWLIAPHHGGNAGTPRQTRELMKTLLDRSEASSVFFSFSRDRYNLPLEDVVAEVSSRTPRVAVRCSQLSKSCSEFLDQARSARGVIAQGAQDSPMKCCAGSIVVSIGPDGDAMHLGAERHDEFVENFPKRLCRSHPTK